MWETEGWVGWGVDEILGFGKTVCERLEGGGG